MTQYLGSFRLIYTQIFHNSNELSDGTADSYANSAFIPMPEASAHACC
jgi:hypothetical protein